MGKIYYMDPNINFLVEVKTVSDLKDMCQLQVRARHVLLFPAHVCKRRVLDLSGCTTLLSAGSPASMQQVEMWEPAGAALLRLKRLATPSSASASAGAG